MRYIKYCQIGNISVELPESQINQKESLFKKAAKWALGSWIKGQVGTILGGIFASITPAFAISGALLIACVALYLMLSNPGFEAIAPTILGLALGVLG